MVYPWLEMRPLAAGKCNMSCLLDLTSEQWALLREVARDCPLSLDAIGHFQDLRRLIKEKLVTVSRAKVSATPSGIEALWYHCKH